MKTIKIFAVEQIENTGSRARTVYGFDRKCDAESVADSIRKDWLDGGRTVVRDISVDVTPEQHAKIRDRDGIDLVEIGVKVPRLG